MLDLGFDVYVLEVVLEFLFGCCLLWVWLVLWFFLVCCDFVLDLLEVVSWL